MIWDILRNAANKWGERVAVYCDGVSITYGALLKSSEIISHSLKEKAFCRKCNQMLIFDNSIQFVKTFFALNKYGAIIVPVYFNTPQKKIMELAKFYDIQYIITKKEKIEDWDLSLIASCTALTGIVSMKNDTLFYEYQRISDRYCIEQKEDDLAMILLSSGTTGEQKGIMLSNRNIESNVDSISEYLGLYKEDRVLLIKSLNHISSIVGEMLVSIYNGCTLYMSTKVVTPSLIFSLIEQNKITVLFVVPTLLSMMTFYLSNQKFDIESLRIMNFYGAPASENLLEKVAEKFDKVNLIYSYGQTEASPRITYIERNDLLTRKKSCGKAIRNVEVFIEGNPEPFSIGEVLVKGPNVMLGIYKNHDQTENILKGGYLHTRDLGYMDKEGYLYIVGRMDNMIIQAGKNIYPEEIEKILTSCEGVSEALVKSKTDELIGQKIVAYIVMNNQSCSLKAVWTHLRNNLEDYKIPREINIVNHLEKTDSGKIIREGFIYEH